MAIGQEALADELEETQRQLRDVTEERDTWKVRCLRAETEVRALKRQSKQGLGAIDPCSGYASPLESDIVDPRRTSIAALSTTSGFSDKLSTPAAQTDVVVFRLRQELAALQEQHKQLETSNSELKEAYHQQEVLLSQPQHTPRGVAYSCDSSMLESPDDLRHKLKEKNEAIMQLQADMSRENKQLEKQKRSAELEKKLCSEELSEMTERAKSFSNLSRKKGDELQAAKKELGKLSSQFEECEARLKGESLQTACLQRKLDEVNFELTRDRTDSEIARGEHRALQDAAKERSLLRGSEHVMLESRLAAYSREASEAMEQKAAAYSKLEEMNATVREAEDIGWQAKQQKVTQGVGLMRQLFGDLQREMRTPSTDRVRRPLEKLASTRSRRGSDAGSANGDQAGTTSEKVMMRLLKHLDRIQQVIDQPVPKLAGRSSSPEGEHPQPEEQRKLFQLLSSDSNEILQQELNDYRLEAEEIREKITSEHLEELDFLVNQFNDERRKLHNDIQEISDRCAKAEVAGAAARPMSEIRTHVESQVANMKRELVSQVTDFHEREREKRSVDERGLEQMQKTLEKCQADLAAGQEEFKILSTLFDKERRENLQLKSNQKLLELQLEAEKEGPHRNVSTASSMQPASQQHYAPHERAHPVHHSGWTSASAHHPSNSSTAFPREAIIATAGTSSHHLSDDRTPFDDRNRSPDTSGTWDLMLHPTTMSQGTLADAHTLTPQGGTPAMTPPRGATPVASGMAAPPPMMAQRAWTEGSEGGSTPGASRHTPTGPMRRGGQVMVPSRVRSENVA